MKKNMNYWTDENGNKWNADIYSKEQAEKYSKSLIDCSFCNDFKINPNANRNSNKKT